MRTKKDQFVKKDMIITEKSQRKNEKQAFAKENQISEVEQLLQSVELSKMITCRKRENTELL